MIDRLLDGVDVCVSTDFFAEKNVLTAMADKIVYTGAIDAYFNYCYGKLSYRTVRFETELLEGVENYQGNAVVTEGSEPYYPVNDVTNEDLYKKYKELACKEKKVIFGGRLAEYKYYDMDKVIESALNRYEQE